MCRLTQEAQKKVAPARFFLNFSLYLISMESGRFVRRARSNTARLEIIVMSPRTQRKLIWTYGRLRTTGAAIPGISSVLNFVSSC
jgi:hypothetical protein